MVLLYCAHSKCIRFWHSINTFLFGCFWFQSYIILFLDFLLTITNNFGIPHSVLQQFLRQPILQLLRRQRRQPPEPGGLQQQLPLTTRKQSQQQNTTIIHQHVITHFDALLTISRYGQSFNGCALFPRLRPLLEIHPIPTSPAHCVHYSFAVHFHFRKP